MMVDHSALNGKSTPPKIRTGKGRAIRTSAAVLLTVFIGLAVIIGTHNVDKTITPNDVKAFELILSGADKGLTPNHRAGSFEEEIEFIWAVQDAVLSAAPDGSKPIPKGTTREPLDLYRAGSGFCYDRSRAIEKFLAQIGFRTRHLSIYSTAETKSALKSLITPQISSHAVTEVLTSKGWLVVDSNARWIALDARGWPVSIAEMQKRQSSSTIAWHATVPDRINSKFSNGFVYVYGLYSRHGEFYPPMTPIPDVNWADFMGNFL